VPNRALHINSRPVGPGHPAYIIAEISANHNQDFDQAVKLIEVAKGCGVDAVKLQTYTPDTMTIDADAPPFRINGTIWNGRKLYDLYAEATTPWPWQPKLKTVANDLGLDLFSTPFDATSVDFLESMEVPAYKIASFENVDMPLLRRVAQTGRPIIMSTGMATLAEIDEAVRTIRAAGGSQLALLKCTSAYPAPAEEMNLRTIPHLADAFDVVVGLSDHTLDATIPVAAVALGASIIEKHIALSRSAPGPDSAFSLEPHEFRAMVSAVRTAERALGQIQYGVSEREASSRVFRRSLFVVQDVSAGEMFTPSNVRAIRPGHGMHTRHIDEVMGRPASRNIARGTPLEWGMVGASAE
jgi:N-acetylneuraminate synthase